MREHGSVFIGLITPCSQQKWVLRGNALSLQPCNRSGVPRFRGMMMFQQHQNCWSYLEVKPGAAVYDGKFNAPMLGTATSS